MLWDDPSVDDASTVQKSIRPAGISPAALCLCHMPFGVLLFLREETSKTSIEFIGTYDSISIQLRSARRIRS